MTGCIVYGTSKSASVPHQLTIFYFMKIAPLFCKTYPTKFSKIFSHNHRTQAVTGALCMNCFMSIQKTLGLAKKNDKGPRVKETKRQG